MEIKKIQKAGLEEATRLVWNTFLEYEAPEYSEEGIKTFKNCIYDVEFINKLELYGAYESEVLLGVIATRNEGNHIALFFVKDDYQGNGIGRQLFETVLNKSASEVMTVNSSMYAVEIYRRLGFVATDKEQLTEGIRFTPMKRIKTEKK